MDEETKRYLQSITGLVAAGLEQVVWIAQEIDEKNDYPVTAAERSMLSRTVDALKDLEHSLGQENPKA